MESWQKLVVLAHLFINLLVFIKGYHECKNKKNAYGETLLLFPLGVFVWGDAVIFGLFWLGISIFSLILDDWFLFLLFVSVFWVVRSLGETIYWLNQQYSGVIRNPHDKLRFYELFQNDSIWFIYQICWQCVTVVSIIFSIYLGKLWIDSRF